MNASGIAIFCAAAVVLIITPGPNFLYILTRATQGRRSAIVAAIGLGVGVLVHTALAAIGVAALVRSSYAAFHAVKYGGSLYLLYLGVQALRAPDRPCESSALRPQHDLAIVGQSVVASLTNPKTILFFLSFLPQFVDPRAGSPAAQMLVLGGIYMALTVVAYSAVGYFAGGASNWMDRRWAAGRRVRWITASSFFGLGLWAALPDRR